MPARHAISDANWERVRHLLPGQPGQHGGIAKDNRRFLDAVLWVAKTGAAWRDLPPRLGKWNSQWHRFDRWAAKGRWAPILAELKDEDLEWLVLDSTVVRAHACAAGQKKSGTALVVRPSKRSVAVGAALAPRSTAVSAPWGIRSNYGSRRRRHRTSSKRRH